MIHVPSEMETRWIESHVSSRTAQSSTPTTAVLSSHTAATPVCLLYSTDTVGGNSGSPVLDADGKFIGINFDRQRMGLMNEFKWSHDYSRSIGTDVRYILFLVGDYDGAQWLVDEMVGSA